MRYVSLHHHSTFSYLDGYGLPESHVRRATELNMGTLALTEHGNISSHVKLEQAALEQGVKPIFGCELYTGGVTEATRTQRKNHLTVLAENQVGYNNLLKLVTLGWQQFYYEPTVSPDDIKRHKDGLVILSGCTGSLLATSLVGGKNVPDGAASYQRARRVAAAFKREFGDRYFLEVQAFPELPTVVKINEAYERLSNELGIELVATGDVHYTKPSENEMQQILHNVRGGNKQTLEEQARSWGYNVPLSPPINDKVMLQRLMHCGLSRQAAIRAILNTETIGQMCTVTMPKLERLRFPVPYGYKDTDDVWRSWLKDGWKYRGVAKFKDVKRYKDRLAYEMSIIEQKDFVDYFLVVSDIVKFAKDRGIPVGPGRGSAAASLVCWLLRITEVNPLAFPSMLFERFIDLSRADLPDIDLDFDDERRGEVFEYAAAKYGRERTGSIGSFTQYKAKNSIDDVARVYRVPKWAAEQLKDALIERSSGDLRASATILDTIDQFEAAAAAVKDHPDLLKATSLEGQVRGMGVHAAGLVIANGPLTDVVAIYERVVAGQLRQVISTDKYDSEYLNILKIDALGLNTLAALRIMLDFIDKPLEWLYEIPLDDPTTIKGFQANDVVGVFQFDGRAMRSVNGELKPDNFIEVRDVNALARPGPLHNNATAEYVDVKRGRKEPRRLHPMLDAICGDTHYQIVYQEQILRIVREIGDFDWTAASYIRKIISRKIGEQEFARQWDKFWAGAQRHGMDEETARAIWGQCITAGSYAFNVAHSTSYGMLAWWTMYMKQHHPTAFYVASLRKYDKQRELLRDAMRHGITIEPPSASRSGVTWTYDKSTPQSVLPGLTQIKGIGEETAKKIVEARDAADAMTWNWDSLRSIKGIGDKKISTIKEFCAQEDPFEVLKLKRDTDKVINYIRRNFRGRIPVPTHTSEEVPYSREDHNTQVVWAGVIRHINLRELFELNFSRTGKPLDPETVRDPHLNEWVILVGADDTELLTCTIDRWKYPSMKKAVWDIQLDHDIVIFEGVKYGFQSRRAIKVTDMWVIDPDKVKSQPEGKPVVRRVHRRAS